MANLKTKLPAIALSLVTLTAIPMMIVDEADIVTYLTDEKGNPILADSLKLQYGSKEQPAGTTKELHFFCYTFALNLADTAYCFDDKKGGIYFFWDEDTKAFASAAGMYTAQRRLRIDRRRFTLFSFPLLQLPCCDDSRFS